jgi:hypothetical protein
MLKQSIIREEGEGYTVHTGDTLTYQFASNENPVTLMLNRKVSEIAHDSVVTRYKRVRIELTILLEDEDYTETIDSE